VKRVWLYLHILVSIYSNTQSLRRQQDPKRL